MPPEVVQAWDSFMLQKATTQRDKLAKELEAAELEVAHYQAPLAQ